MIVSSVEILWTAHGGGGAPCDPFVGSNNSRRECLQLPTTLPWRYVSTNLSDTENSETSR